MEMGRIFDKLDNIAEDITEIKEQNAASGAVIAGLIQRVDSHSRDIKNINAGGWKVALALVTTTIGGWVYALFGK